MMCLGAFYLIEQGPFLGLVQIIVYTGAIMILFLFVLMLVGRDSSDSIVETLRGQRWRRPVRHRFRAARRAWRRPRVQQHAGQPRQAERARRERQLDRRKLLFTKYLFAFELTSALLIVAAVGAMVLAHIEREGPKPTQKALARERIRSGRPQPLPGPGVLSTGNSIGTPALLPDGSIAHESVMVGKEQFTALRTGEPGLRALDTSDYDDSEIDVMTPYYYLVLSAALFTIGAVGVLVRRNAIVVFMCVELMLNAVNLTLVTFSRINGDLEGQVMAFFVMVVAAAEVVVGLAIIMSIFRTRRSASVDDANLLKY